MNKCYKRTNERARKRRAEFLKGRSNKYSVKNKPGLKRQVSQEDDSIQRIYYRETEPDNPYTHEETFYDCIVSSPINGD